jgi:hypothetical protein
VGGAGYDAAVELMADKRKESLPRRCRGGGRPSTSEIARAVRTALVLSFSLCLAGCSVKSTVKVAVPDSIREARSATLDELLDQLNRESEAIQALSTATMRVTFTSGKVDSGKLESYRSAPGYLLLKGNDRLRLNIQNPITKTTIVDIASAGDQFVVWLPRDNRMFEGLNSMREFDLESGPSFTARPRHILEAIMPAALRLDSPGFRVSLREDRDAANKYYVLSLYREAGRDRLEPIRDVWVERGDLTVARQVFFGTEGQVASRVTYSGRGTGASARMPLHIVIERPGDGYSLDLQFRSWNLNPELPEDAFTLRTPPGAERVVLKEKSGS